jgi:hypothetical protein
MSHAYPHLTYPSMDTSCLSFNQCILVTFFGTDGGRLLGIDTWSYLRFTCFEKSLRQFLYNNVYNATWKTHPSILWDSHYHRQTPLIMRKTSHHSLTDHVPFIHSSRPDKITHSPIPMNYLASLIVYQHSPTYPSFNPHSISLPFFPQHFPIPTLLISHIPYMNSHIHTQLRMCVRCVVIDYEWLIQLMGIVVGSGLGH